MVSTGKNYQISAVASGGALGQHVMALGLSSSSTSRVLRGKLAAVPPPNYFNCIKWLLTTVGKGKVSCPVRSGYLLSTSEVSLSNPHSQVIYLFADMAITALHMSVLLARYTPGLVICTGAGLSPKLKILQTSLSQRRAAPAPGCRRQLTNCTPAL